VAGVVGAATPSARLPRALACEAAVLDYVAIGGGRMAIRSGRSEGPKASITLRVASLVGHADRLVTGTRS
jgi:hypothetical protein